MESSFFLWVEGGFVVFFDKEVRGRLSVCLPKGVRPVSVLGKGGCAVVVRVQFCGSSQPVAMKIALEGGEEQIKNERNALNDLRGVRGVTQLRELGEDHATCLAYEAVDGRTMEAYFGREFVTLERALRLIARLADVVSDIHSRGIVHRDLKPENVMVRWKKESVPVVIDFGLAMRYGRGDPLADHVSGTLGFMAPEAFNAECPPDPARDLYALGVLLYRTCEGTLPFRGMSTVEMYMQHHLVPIPTLPSRYPPGLNDLIGMCLQKSAARRLSDAKVFARALREVIEELGPLGSELIPQSDLARARNVCLKTLAVRP